MSTINFHGTKLDVAVHEGRYYVAVKPICDGVGISDRAQRSTLAGDVRFNWANIVLVAGDGKQRVMFCIPLDQVNLWLANIRTDRRRSPEVQARLDVYQRECADVLYKHFLPNGADDLRGFFNNAFEAGFQRMEQHYAQRLEPVEAKVAGVSGDLTELQDRVRLLEERAKREDEEAAENPFKRKVGDKVH